MMPTEMKSYHGTTRGRALEILAHGLAERDVVTVGSCSGVRLLISPMVDTPPLDYTVNIVDDILFKPVGDWDDWDDGRDWQPMPLGRIHDPIGATILEVTFTEEVQLEDYQYQEEVVLRNRKTNETRSSDHFIWTGEWLVPLEVAQRGDLRLLETRVDEELLQRQLARWRAHFTEQGFYGDVIERRLTLIEEQIRAWRPELPE